MQILIAPTEDIVLGERTSFSADEEAGQTVLSVDNPQGYSAAGYLILGKPGSETAEVRKIASTSTNSITVTVATTFKHYSAEAITALRYDQRKFYRSTSETGTYSHLSAEGSPVNIEVDKPEGTRFEDSSGTSTSWYKSTYFNSTTSEETDLADAVAVKAGDAESYTSIFKIRQEAGFEDNDYISSELINRYREESQMQVDGSIAIAYSLPLASIPKIITHITTLLAAGLLLSKEYGTEADVEVSKTGQRKIERAEALLQRIVNGELLLVDSSGSELSKKSTYKVSGSNSYDSSIPDKGEMFNLRDENFRLTDPTEPTSSGDRISDDSQRVGTQWSSQK